MHYCGNIVQCNCKIPWMEDFEDIDASEDILMLWKEIKRICTVGLMNNADPDKILRDANFRFQGVHQRYIEPVSAFVVLLQIPSRM